MNNRTEILSNSYKPQLADVVYKSSNKNDYYLESHDINNAGQLLQGKPLLQETMQGIVDVFFDERKNMVKVGGLMPDNLLSFGFLPGGNYRMVWYRPAEIRLVHFASQLKLPSTKVWVPALLYSADNAGMDIFALKSNARPNEKTKLFRAPFYNVDDDGNVCLGNAKVKKPTDKTYSALMKYWEDLFWLSEFTHVNGDTAVKTNINKVWKRLLNSRTKLKWSDIDELIPSTESIKNLLK